MRIEGVPSTIYAPQPVQRPVEPSGDQQIAGPSFGEQVTNAIGQINDLQAKASDLVEKVATGQVEDVHKAMIAMEHASLSFNFGLQVRNKALEAYQEIMKTQI